jgi:very-short-patch-repair endonuclease
MEEHQVQHTGVARFQYTKFAESQEVPLPPRDEQRAIAHILGTLDEKIELNRRMSETLEAMARALFKSWFVDFDPVRAKMGVAPHPKSLSRGERDFLLPSPPGRGAGGEGTTSPRHTNAPLPTALLDFARQLRGEATDAETLLWRLLRGRQVADAKFRRQHPFPPYILDFYCHELKLAVELDGGQHDEPHHRSRDACVFHAKLDTDSTASWTVIPRQAGHLFQGKLDT